jgi:hypothetical protein
MKMKIVMQFLIGVSFVAIAACGGSGGSGGDDEVAAVNDNPCGTVVDIGPNSIFDGVLETGDCRVTDFDPTSGDTSFIDEYRITVNSMAILTINMRSASIDSVLFLMNRSTSCTSGCTPADIITFDDDSGGGVNGEDALISMDLAPGTYLIGANSFIPGTGSYTLETSFRNPIGPYMIGQIGPAGGIVFYITNGGLNGLEAAPVDQSAGAPWGCQGMLLFANGTAIGDGAQNTADILAGCVDLGIAARLADNYSLNGFNDWFLPSQDELNELYLQRAVVGGFTTAFFWSSSEGFAVSAWGQDFNDGSVFNGDKNNITGVRAIRAF